MEKYRMCKPATCAVCTKETIEPLIFSDYSRQIETHGPPTRGHGWFCKKHAEEALALHVSSLPEALAALNPVYLG